MGLARRLVLVDQRGADSLEEVRGAVAWLGRGLRLGLGLGSGLGSGSGVGLGLSLSGLYEGRFKPSYLLL